MNKNMHKKDMSIYDMYVFEKALYERGFNHIAGLDEAGRGPLFGEVFAAAVIFEKGFAAHPDINDSKKLSEKKREALYDIIVSSALCYAVSSISVEEIEEINILEASLKAMRMAVKQLSVTPDFLIIDGNISRGFPIESKAIIAGDSKSVSIAAASILAKVTRDRRMKELDLIYPQYALAKNKGYGTKAHIEAIKSFGPCKLHRKSFLKKILSK